MLANLNDKNNILKRIGTIHDSCNQIFLYFKGYITKLLYTDD